MNKIKLSEFWNSKEKLAIHCKMEEQAIKLLKEFDKMGKKWASGNSYLEVNCWNGYEEDTCYSNNNGYTFINWYKENNYKIYDFEDVDFEEKKKMKRKIKLRDMTKEQWDANRDSLCKFKTMQSCDECIFKWVNCLKSSYKELWIYHKDLYSDKFLDQEVEIEVDVLDKEEKEYLANVIKPFRDEIDCIFKHKNDMTFKSYISIKLKDKTYIHFLDLKDNKMYAKMELDYHYTLDELGL